MFFLQHVKVSRHLRTCIYSLGLIVISPPSTTRAMADEDACYHYNELDSAKLEHRILVLLGCSNPEDEIRCDLICRRFEVESNPEGGQHRIEVPYEALSYVWGDPEPPAYIYLEGHKHRVTTELFKALKALRPPNDFRFLWVDALCINQEDIPERNQQVRLMGRIYSEANNVLMWIGQESSDSDLAMGLLSEIQKLTILEELDSKKFQSIVFDASYNDHWTALKQLLNRPYWSRVWILQEVILSKQAILYCGSRNVSWAILRTLAGEDYMLGLFRQQSWHARATFTQSPFLLLLARLDAQYCKGGSLSMLDGLVLSRQRSAKKSHDYVYGILNLVDLNGLAIETDYEKPLRKVYKEIVQQLIEAKGNLDILTACKEFDLDDCDLLAISISALTYDAGSMAPKYLSLQNFYSIWHSRRS
jgi:hypothetical protein